MPPAVPGRWCARLAAATSPSSTTSAMPNPATRAGRWDGGFRLSTQASARLRRYDSSKDCELAVSMPQANTEAVRGLIEVTRLARSGGSLSTRLEHLAATIGESLGYATVVITLYRPAWDDFRISAVSGREDARRALLGCTRTWDDYRPLLDDRFFRRGAYAIPHGEFDWSNAGAVYTPPVGPGEGPDAWHPEDVLLVPLKGANGDLLGMMSVDEPASLRRPDDDDLDLLTAVADHVALAIEDAQADAVATRHRASLQHLLHVSSRLTETRGVDEILDAVCDAIRRALGFQRVSVELLGVHGDGAFSPRA